MTQAGFQPGIFETAYPVGFHVFKGRLEREGQSRMVELARELCREAPLIQPRTKYGTDFNLKITSWGKVGWLSDERDGYHYSALHPETRRPWPQIPEPVKALMLAAAKEAGYPLDLQTVLVNFYAKEGGALGRHQDKTEKNHTSPIVTLSLGDTCVFGIGGPLYSDKVDEVLLESGDVVVQGGPARMYYHEVSRLLPGTSDLLKQGGRISLTGRAYI